MRLRSIVPILCLVVLLSLSIPLQAQTDLECPGGESLAGGLMFDVPDVPEGGLYTVTVIGLDGFDPVLALVFEDGFVDCFDDDPRTDGYGATLPTTGTVTADFTSTGTLIFPEDGITTFVVAGFQQTSGDFLLIMEGVSLETSDWSMTLTASSDYGLNVYLLAADDTLNPALTVIGTDGRSLTDANGAVIQCDDAGTDTCWGTPLDLSSASLTTFDGEFIATADSAALNLPDDVTTDTTLTLTARAQGGTSGTGILALHIMRGMTDSRPAAWSSAERGAALICDGITLFDNGAVVRIPATSSDTPYTVTAVGLREFNPVMGIFVGDSSGGICYHPATSGAPVGLNLPTMDEIITSEGTVRAVIPPDLLASGVMLVIGDTLGAAGEFALMIEGGAVTETDNAPFGNSDSLLMGDGLSVTINASLLDSGAPLITYMIAAEDGFDPLVMRLTDDGNVMDDMNGLPMACDDAGREDLCWNTGEDLSISSVMLADGVVLTAFSPDAMLRLPLDDARPGDRIYLLLSSSNMETFGVYVVILQLGTS